MQPVVQEMIFSAMAEGGPSPNTAAEPLKRLVMEVFNRDLDHFRSVSCYGDPTN